MPMSLTEQWELAQKARHDIKTSKEQKALEDQRPKPVAVKNLNPPGMNPDPNKERREARIAEINASLQKASEGLKKDFEHAR